MNRRSEHDHGLLWVKYGPMYSVNNNEIIEQFVDKYVTCNNSLLPLHLKDLQMQKHRQICKKKNQVDTPPSSLMDSTTNPKVNSGRKKSWGVFPGL